MVKRSSKSSLNKAIIKTIKARDHQNIRTQGNGEEACTNSY